VKDGTVLWVGHPMSIEEPLAQVKAGTFDVAKFKEEFDKRAATTRIQMALNQDVSSTLKMFDAGQRKEAHAKLDDLLAKNPQIKPSVDSITFQWLAQEDPKAWEAKATAMAKSKDPNSIQLLRRYALSQASEKKADTKMVKKAIELALSASDKPDPLTLQYAVLVYEQLKDYDHAATLAGKLVSVLPDDSANAQLRKAMQDKKVELEAKAKPQR